MTDVDLRRPIPVGERMPDDWGEYNGRWKPSRRYPRWDRVFYNGVHWYYRARQVAVYAWLPLPGKPDEEA